MNPELASDLASCHLRDLRQLGEQRRLNTMITPSRRHRRSPLRRQLGVRLVEAGLHLMAGPAD